MVYESDFYTTRRPYRTSPSLSAYTVSSVPSRQVRILPGLGKVHIVHTYDRIVPYVGHKRLTVVTTPPKVYATRPSVLNRQYDWIENKLRPWTAYSATNRYLNSDSAVRIIYSSLPISGVDYTIYPSATYTNNYRIYRPLNMLYDYYFPNSPKSLKWYSDYWPLNTPIRYFLKDLSTDRALKLQRIFDDETRLIRAQTASLLKYVHAPVPRAQRSWPLPYSAVARYDTSSTLPARLSNDYYIHRLLTTSPRNPKAEYTTYYTEPVRKYIGDKAYNRRRNLILYEDPLKSDIQLLSYYINKFRQDKAIQQKEPTKAENVEEKQAEITE